MSNRVIAKPTSKDPRGSLLWQASTLAAGTLASLTGLRKYAEVDAVRVEFMDFCEENEGRYSSWSSAWQTFATLKGFTHGTGTSRSQ